jgi:hypothetical protein
MFCVYSSCFKFSLNVAILTRFSFLLGCFNFLCIDGYCSPCVEVVFFIIFLELVCFPSCRYIVFERHLAARTGINSAFSELMGSFFQTISS